MSVDEVSQELRQFRDNAITDLARIGHEFEEQLDAFRDETAGSRERAEEWQREHSEPKKGSAREEQEDDDDYFESFSATE
ncbi:hypothetical protein EV193_10179 [Herbihabitans rhizosphaerae]|uniref:Uncharacterized protein n=1 Tax=Herbihabitans rhizosphaerae TaxID=1872711 RepID=A0A4Q7L4P9_9PSEU|nr:hypothetical protein [Herbihabitans rhizosphaerae]RZS44204.1 hypothetical protein EV193_10179 [Herbihabitans rhizosphaerae]